MTTIEDVQTFGPYRFVRPLAPGALSERWLAIHDRDHSSHIVYRFPVAGDKPAQRRFLSGIQPASELLHPHLLEIQHYSFDHAGRPCVVTPYCGNQEGLLPLDKHVALKGGRLGTIETERAVLHTLEALVYAHDKAGPANGPIDFQQLLVDRHGSINIEFYGVGRRMAGLPIGGPDLAADEARSVVALAYQMLTGLPAEEPRIAAQRLVRRLEPAWSDWLEFGLDEFRGFATPAAALAALPSQTRETLEVKPVASHRTVWGRLAWLARAR